MNGGERMEKSCLREIEVTVISAEGLRVNRKQPVKKNAYVVVRSDPFNSRSTGMDTEGGSYPAWHQKLVLHLSSHVRFVTVEAHSGKNLLGTANIPVSDFSGGFLPENYQSFLSYRLRDACGQKNGIVNLSVRVKGAEGIGGGGGGGGSAASGSGRVWDGVPGRAVKVFNQGFVTGIPISYTK